jgi:toxin YhaV
MGERRIQPYESTTDAYAVFRKMLKRGVPPDDWMNLVEAAREAEVQRRLLKASRR